MNGTKAVALKPCPLCDRAAGWAAGSDNENSAGATCKTCGLELWEQDAGCMERAARAWNIRPALAERDALREAFLRTFRIDTPRSEIARVVWWMRIRFRDKVDAIVLEQLGVAA